MNEADSIEPGKRIGKVGASNVGALLGYSPWSTPAAETAKILGLITVDQTIRMKFGTEVQPVIANMVKEETGVSLIEDEKTIQHPKIPWMVCTPDYREYGADPVIPYEFKFVGDRVAGMWGESGDPEGVPNDVLCQVIQQANILGIERAVVAALIGGYELRIYPVEVREKDKKALEGAVHSFYEKYIKPGIIPPVDYRDIETLKKLFPKSEPKPITANEEMLRLIGELTLNQQAMKLAKKDFETAKARLQLLMKENDSIIDETGRNLITWKKSKDGFKTDWNEVANKLWQRMGGESGDFIPEIFTDSVAMNTKPKTGNRVFLIKE